MSRFVSASDKVTESTASMQYQMNQSTDSTDLVRQLSLTESRLDALATKYDAQKQEVERLEKAYRSLWATYGRGAEATQKAYKQFASAQVSLANLAVTHEKAYRSYEQLKQQVEQSETPIKKATQSQDRFNRSIREGAKASDNLTSKLKSMLGAYLGFRGAKKGFEATVGAFALLNQQSMMMQASFGDTDIGKAYFNQMQSYAAKTGHKIEELSQTTRNFMQLTKDTEKLRGLTEIANRISLRTDSIGSAEVLMQEAMRGQYTRLQRTLHLTDSQLAPLKEAVQAGSLEGIIGAFDQALNTAGLTNEIVEAFQASPLQKFNSILASFKQRLAGAGEKALERLIPLLDRVDIWLQSESATKFFNAISFGISELAKGIVFLFDLVQNNWLIVRSILIMAGVLIATSIVANLWATIPPLLAQIAPILIIIGLIYMIAKAYVEMGGTIADITGVIGGIFGGLYATVYNVFVQIYNVIATVAEFFVNVWHDPIFAVKRLFIGFVDSILGMLQRVTDAMDFVFKTNMSSSIQQWRNNLNKMVEEVPEGYKVIERMQEISFEDSVRSGYGAGYALPGRFTDSLDSVTEAINDLSDMEAKWNALQYDTLGSIDGNTKQMTDEDLKWLRDAAEQETINRFTAATLAPQMTFHFGDVKETADVDGIVEHVEKVMTELLNTTAEGVHA